MRAARAITITVTLAACKGGDGTAAPYLQPATVEVTAAPSSTLTLIGETRLIRAAVKSASGSLIYGWPITWQSSDPVRVTLSTDTGATTIATALNNGRSRITARAGNATGTVAMTVDAVQNFDVTAGAAENVFDPEMLTIYVGDVVTWHFTGSHTVIFAGGPGSPPNIGHASNPQIGGSVARGFIVAGTYPYYCELHGTPSTGMHGSITVNSRF